MNNPAHQAKYRPSFTASQLQAMELAMSQVLQSGEFRPDLIEPLQQAFRITQLQLTKIDLSLVQPSYVTTGRVTNLDITKREVMALAVPEESAQAIDWESPETWKRSYTICQLAEVTGAKVSAQDLAACKRHCEEQELPLPNVTVMGVTS